MNKIMVNENLTPEQIEKKSFEIIEMELECTDTVINKNVRVRDIRPPGERERIMQVIKRCIHTTADFDYAGSMCFSEGAVEKFDDLIRRGATIVTDTNMALAGINKKALLSHGCEAVCFMSDEDVAREAVSRGVTRAHVSMERAMKLTGPVVFVTGNAPTALITLRDHYDRGDFIPEFIIGVPVGFVNVTSAKELILETDIPYIINSGRKGGSNVAAAIVNALLYNM